MKATCKKDKVEILEYCKKVYPERDITNIVESSHYVKINNWCKLGMKKCRTGSQQWVKPYRCLGEKREPASPILTMEGILKKFFHINYFCYCVPSDQSHTLSKDPISKILDIMCKILYAETVENLSLFCPLQFAEPSRGNKQKLSRPQTFAF